VKKKDNPSLNNEKSDKMKRKMFTFVLFSIIFISVGFMGCTDDPPKEDPGYVLLSESAQESGHLDNPEWDGAAETQITYDYSVNGSIITRIVATLTWTDDHSGSDSQDIKDIFSLRVSGGESSVNEESDSGNIKLELEVNETAGENSGLGDTVSVTVACVECGTYNEPPLIGPFLRYWDTGNDFSLKVEYDYLEPAEG